MRHAVDLEPFGQGRPHGLSLRCGFGLLGQIRARIAVQNNVAGQEVQELDREREILREAVRILQA